MSPPFCSIFFLDCPKRTTSRRQAERFVLAGASYVSECLKGGCWTMIYTHRVRIQPAMTMAIDDGTVASATAILAEVFDLIVQEGYWK